MKARGAKKANPVEVQEQRKQANEQTCSACEKTLEAEARALFVEEDVGRIFCSEDCIVAHFKPEIDRLEEDYLSRLTDEDLSSEERQALGHLRWNTLERPDEIWREKTLAGDFRYTMIAEFEYSNVPIWCVCISLFLRGEPSFLFVALMTKNRGLVDHYRNGEPVDPAELERAKRVEAEAAGEETGSKTDRLAEPWTAEETFKARMLSGKNSEDIPLADHAQYERCLESTLQAPDEVWTHTDTQGSDRQLYHFIRYFADLGVKGVWYVAVARETEAEDEIEILDAFPTRDTHLVDRYRTGQQEIGSTDLPAASGSRLVH